MVRIKVRGLTGFYSISQIFHDCTVMDRMDICALYDIMIFLHVKEYTIIKMNVNLIKGQTWFKVYGFVYHQFLLGW